MKGSKFADAQIAFLLQQASEGTSVAEVCRKAGDSRSDVLQLRNKPPKRRVKAKLLEDRAVATQFNKTCAMDFVHDQLVTGPGYAS